MAKDHGSSVKDGKQYEGLRKKGMSKQRAASIANSPDASSKGGKNSGGKGSGGSKAQKRAAGREGGQEVIEEELGGHVAHEPTPYDRSFAEALDHDGASELRERLLSGAPTDEARSEARAHLDETTRRRFELAHPIAPRQQDLELEAETIELSIGDLSKDKSWKQHANAIRDELRKAADASGRGHSDRGHSALAVDHRTLMQAREGGLRAPVPIAA